LNPDFLDLLRALSDAEVAWPCRLETTFGEGVRCSVIGLEHFLKNKRAAGRPQDLADVAAIERLERLKK
jgi:hypothetical protein